MDFEMNYENMENIEETEPIIEDVKEADDFPPKFSAVKGETVEHRAARHELESDIARGLEIAAENSLARLEKIEAEEAKKK